MVRGLDKSRLRTSTIWWPEAVVQFKRNSGSPPSATKRRDTSERDKGITSIGSGNLPKRETYLLSSATQTKRSAALATIFSANSAAPPPLIICKVWLISSAPSTYTASFDTSLNCTSGMPNCAINSEVFFEVATAPLIFLPLLPKASTKRLTVVPVPMPIYSFSGTNSTAFSAAMRFNSSCDNIKRFLSG